MSSAWLYYYGAKAGLTRVEVRMLPLGEVFDQIAVYQIAECGAKEKRRSTRMSGSLYQQMGQLGR